MIALGGGILTVAAAGAGVFFLVKGSGAKDEAAEQRDDMRRQGQERGLRLRSECIGPSGERPAACEGLADKWERVNRLYRAADVSFLVGGALLVGTVATYLLWPRKSEITAERRTFTWSTTVSASERSISVRTSF